MDQVIVILDGPMLTPVQCIYFNSTFNRMENVYDQVFLLQIDIAFNFYECFITNSELDVNYKQIHSGWLNSIETCYEHLVYVLIQAAKESIPNKKTNSFKFWWNPEAEILKQNSIASHRDWLNNGRPISGSIYNLKTKAKRSYKLYIKQNKCNEKKYRHF